MRLVTLLVLLVREGLRLLRSIGLAIILVAWLAWLAAYDAYSTLRVEMSALSLMTASCSFRAVQKCRHLLAHLMQDHAVYSCTVFQRIWC